MSFPNGNNNSQAEIGYFGAGACYFRIETSHFLTDISFPYRNMIKQIKIITQTSIDTKFDALYLEN